MLLEDTYFLSEYDSLCSNKSGLAVVDKNECHHAVSKLHKYEPNAEFSSEESSVNWPNGCYIYGISTMKVNWNQNPDGRANKWSRQICKLDGTNNYSLCLLHIILLFLIYYVLYIVYVYYMFTILTICLQTNF